MATSPEDDGTIGGAPSRKAPRRGTWIAIGIAIGVGVGVAMGNIAIGVGVGVALGAGIEAANRRKSAR